MENNERTVRAFAERTMGMMYPYKDRSIPDKQAFIATYTKLHNDIIKLVSNDYPGFKDFVFNDDIQGPFLSLVDDGAYWDALCDNRKIVLESICIIKTK